MSVAEESVTRCVIVNWTERRDGLELEVNQMER